METEKKIIDVICKNVVKKYFYFVNVTSISIKNNTGVIYIIVNCVVDDNVHFIYRIQYGAGIQTEHSLILYRNNKPTYTLVPGYQKYWFSIDWILYQAFDTAGYEFLNIIWPYSDNNNLIQFITNEYIRVRKLLPKLKIFLLINVRLKLFCRDILGLISNLILFFFVFFSFFVLLLKKLKKKKK